MHTDIREVIAVLVTSFSLGQYTNIPARGNDTNEVINAIFSRILDDCDIEFDQEELNNAVQETIDDLERKLTADNKTLALYCHVQKITSREELFEYVKVQIMSNTLETAAILKIAEQENISVTEQDLNFYKTEYRALYANVERDSVEQLERDLKLAILTRKVLAFLFEKNIP